MSNAYIGSRDMHILHNFPVSSGTPSFRHVRAVTRA